MSKKEERFNNVERLEVFEDRLGVSFDGVYATLTWFDGKDDDGEKFITVNGEIRPVSGSAIKEDFRIKLVAYGSNGEVLGMNWDCDCLEAETFFGFHVFSITLTTLIRPKLIRIFPTK